MKVTYNWLKDFVEMKIPPKQLAEKLTMAGLEVTSLEEKEGDFIFEIEVTSNRPDCLSVIGLAREVAAITGKKLKLPKVSGHQVTLPVRQTGGSSGRQLFSIKIENKKDCPLYTAKIIKDVKVRPSPNWLKQRLGLIGCRSVNNIVDITNYVLFTYGEPLHAFDSDKLSSDTIVVRRGKKDEKITTIDGEEKTLNPDILVIADREKAVAIAGIMGGKDTEVTESTKNILLEGAAFNPIIIRRGRQKLGIQTESSYRFERGIDLESVEFASGQATKHIREIAGGRFALAKGSLLPKRKKKTINLSLTDVKKILGVNIPVSKIKTILINLGFKLRTKKENNFTVEIPSFRCDVNLEIDLIEEIARIFGYEKIPKTLPKVSLQITANGIEDLVSLTKNILAGLGLNEVITYSLIEGDLLQDLGMKETPPTIEILNPLSKEQEILRPRIIPGLVGCVANNLNQKQAYVNIFEIAKVFSVAAESLKEELVLAIALCGVKSLLLEQGLIKEEVGLLHLKGIFEVLFERLGIKDYKFNSKDNPSQILIYVNKEKIGIMKIFSRNRLEKLDIKNKDVLVVEVSLDKLFSYANLSKKFAALPIYPAMSRDISFILREGIAIDEVLKSMREKGSPLLREVKIVDYYKGKQIPSGYRSLTVSCLYRLDERTLTEAEINPVHSLVTFVLADKFSAQIRKT